MSSFMVVGVGRFGASLATELFALGHDVLVIDQSEEEISKISQLVTHVVIGDAKDQDVLNSVGVDNFDYVIVTIGSSLENSIIITLLLKEMGVKQILCKASGELHAKALRLIGADRVIRPEHDMGKRVANSLGEKNILEYIEISEDYSISEISVPKSWINKTIIECNIRKKYRVNVVALKDEEDKIKNISPSADTLISKGDKIVAIGSIKDLEEVSLLR